MKLILAVIWSVAEYFIQLNNWVAFLERRYSKKKTAVLFGIFTVFLAMFGFIRITAPFRTVIMFFMVLSAIHILFKDKLYRKVCVNIIYFICAILGEAVAIFIAKYVYGLTVFDMNEKSFANLLWQITAYLLIIIFNILCTMIFRKKKVYENIDMLRPVILFIGFQNFILASIMMVVVQSALINQPIIWILIMTFICSVVGSLFIYKTVKHTTEKSMEAEYIKKESEMKDKHFKEIKEQYLEYRKLRHDFANHLRIIKEFEKSEKLVKYTDEIQAHLDSTRITSYCENLTLDALFALKSTEARQKHIDIRYEICDLSHAGDISDFDMCTVAANLLDNAIEAAEKTDDKFIEFKIDKRIGKLVITVRNSSPEVDGTLKTTKQDSMNHGIGVSSIRTIAEKHNGDYAFKFDNDEYVSVVTMDL